MAAMAAEEAAAYGGYPQQGLGQPADAFGFGFEDVPTEDFFGGTGPEQIMESRVTVVRGKWIRDAVTGQLLEVPEMTTDLEDNKSLYSNDGQTLGDVTADDEIWTNVETVEGEFIGPTTQVYILYYINMLRLLYEMSPLQFAGAPVASPDPISPLPQLDNYAQEQESWILDWNERFLYDFRQPDPITGMVSPRGEFYPIFVPAPPFRAALRPRPQYTEPPPDFVGQAWVGFQGGVPDPSQITSVTGTAQGGYGPGVGGYPGYYGEGAGAVPGAAGGEDLFGGSAAGQSYGDTGQSTYF